MASAFRWTWKHAQAGWTGLRDHVNARAEAVFQQGQGVGSGNTASTTSRQTLDFPALWSFITSRYTIALLICAALANRIIAIVPPTTLQIPYRSSAKARACVRAPAIILLSRACLLIVGMLAKLSADQEASPGYYSVTASNILGKQEASFSHAEVLWSCFVAACTAVACESFVRALDRDLAATIPVNLFSLGLLLHYHSLPSSDPIVPPTRQVYILLLLSLMEILALHLVAIPAWRARLWVTATFAVVSRGAMIYFWVKTSGSNHAALMPAIQSLGRILPEAFFVACSLSFVVLRGLVQIITEGRLNSNIFGHSSALPHRDDDFIIALIKYGTATLEATAMKGLNNEVSMLSVPSNNFVELHGFSTSSASANTLGTGQVQTVHPAYDRPQLANSPNPFENNVRQIKAVSEWTRDVDPMSKNTGQRKEMWRFCKALYALWRIYFIGWLARKTGVHKLASGQGRFARWLRRLGVHQPDTKDASQGLRGSRDRTHGWNAGNMEVLDDDASDMDFVPEDSEDEGSSSSSSDSDSDKAEDEDAAETVQYQEHALVVHDPSASRESTPGLSAADEMRLLLTEDVEQEDALPMLVAHLRSARQGHASSPLTRRRYNALTAGIQSSSMPFGGTADEMALSTAIASRRAQVGQIGQATGGDRWDDTTFREPSSCVVCCAEQRTIVLWPCRCLALCNDCRAELGARSSQMGGSSLCPCCRTAIQGYSRILIP